MKKRTLDFASPFVDSEYVHRETLSCAEGGCIPCIYKIIPNGTFSNEPLMPNVRPELCPRSTRFVGGPDDLIYRSTDQILTLGDGDLSFSMALARRLGGKSHHRMVASTYEPLETLLEIYQPQITGVLKSLRDMDVECFNGVDATSLRTTLPEGKYGGYFDRIIWNFPCVRAMYGADGQVTELEDNKRLLSLFFSNCDYLLKKSADGAEFLGEVHIVHKTVEPFSWWDIIGIALSAGFRCRGVIVFDKYLYPGYVNKKALDNKSFPLHDARVSFKVLCVVKVY
jgi:25S rRNA (uracil2634-N3)-methyltransferase